jgi:hypothetical protein
MVREDIHMGAASSSPSPERQRKRKAEEDWEDPQSKVNRIRAWENAHVLLLLVNVLMAQRGIRSSQSELAYPFENLMKVRGWVKYEPTSTNTPRVLYKAEDGTRAC